MGADDVRALDLINLTSSDPFVLFEYKERVETGPRQNPNREVAPLLQVVGVSGLNKGFLV